MTLDRITSPTLAVQHGFFSRQGGVSTGVYAGLNCGLGSKDSPDLVHHNRHLVARALGVDDGSLARMHQVHSALALGIDAPLEISPEVDALVTATPGLALSVLSADCAPVLFADVRAGVIGAAHAGWRGALGGVLEASVAKMEGYGAQRSDIRAVIGPCISQKAYEVGPEFFDRFTAQDPANSAFFIAGTGDRLLFNLPGFVRAQLEATGIGAAQWTGHCTYSDPERFFSYRRATHAGEADYGRLIAALRL